MKLEGIYFLKTNDVIRNIFRANILKILLFTISLDDFLS